MSDVKAPLDDVETLIEFAKQMRKANCGREHGSRGIDS